MNRTLLIDYVQPIYQTGLHEYFIGLETNEIFMEACLVDGLYIINQERPIHAAMLASLSPTLTTWHERFGHINIQRLKAMKDGSVKGITFNEIDMANFKCEACILGKA